MIVESGLEREAFKTLLQKFLASIDSTDKWHKARLKSWDHFSNLNLPTKNDEPYRYIKLRQLFSQSYQLPSETNLSAEQIESYIQPECQNSVLVFVNGNYCAKLSRTNAIPSQITISSLQDALDTYGTFLNNHWNKSLKEETDPFVVLNGALHQKGVFLYIPPKTIAEQPIQFLHVITADNQLSMINPRLNIFVGAHAEVSFASTQQNLSDQPYFVNQVIEMTLEENSKAYYAQNLCDEHASSWHLNALRSTLKRNASLKTVAITKGSATVRSDYRVILMGENAEVLLNGLSMLKDKRESHTNIWIEHQAPHCRSFQLFKSVLDDFSRTSFEGKIMVRQAAQKTEAFQLNNNIILSDHAQANSKPNLEIFADDVKASHGATIGQLDPEQLFYMKTRGFNQAEAMNLLIFGFCEQIIDMLNIDSMKQTISLRLVKK